ncbi:MAG TPA: ABC transporter ATP-binding protein [Methanosarcinaceae archaeon]|nr:ABC transporter ATP-binding protein [Methanosarcinaceae archaeon]
MIDAKNLTKSFGKVDALKGLNLHVNKGSIHGLIGPNGAGKSTTIKILSTLIRVDSGEVMINDIPIKRGVSVRSLIGVVPETPRLHEDKSARSELVFHSKLYGMPKKEAKTLIRNVISAVQLEDAADRLIRGYSTGMKKRVALALALLHDPEILLLDEPMSGLDPVIRKQFKETILDLKEMGKTILVSDHDLYTVEELCDSVTIIQDGKTVVEDTIESLRNKTGSIAIEIKVSDDSTMDGLESKLTSLDCVTDVSQKRGWVIVKVRDSKTDIPVVIHTASNHTDILEARQTKITLEDIFLKYAGGHHG